MIDFKLYTEDVYVKWENTGLLHNCKNVDNMIFIYEYLASKFTSEILDYSNNKETLLFPISYRIFSKFTVNLNKDYIINKLNLLIESYDTEYKNHFKVNSGFLNIDIEAGFCLAYSRKNHPLIVI